MDSKIMELRLKQWIPIFEEQAKSGLSKQEWCRQNDVHRVTFFKWQREFRNYLLEKNENKLQNLFSTEHLLYKAPDFVELTPTTSLVHSRLNDSNVGLSDITPTSSIRIKCGEFSIELNEDVNELFLSKILKVIADVC